MAINAGNGWRTMRNCENFMFCKPSGITLTGPMIVYLWLLFSYLLCCISQKLCDQTICWKYGENPKPHWFKTGLKLCQEHFINHICTIIDLSWCSLPCTLWSRSQMLMICGGERRAVAPEDTVLWSYPPQMEGRGMPRDQQPCDRSSVVSVTPSWYHWKWSHYQSLT